MADEIKVDDVKKDEAKAVEAKPKNFGPMKASYTPSSTLSQAISGRGNQLAYSTTSTGTSPVSILEMKENNLPKVTQGKIEATHYLSAGVEYIANGWPEIGDQTFKVNYTRAQAIALYALAQAGTTLYWTATLPDGTTAGTTYKFAGFISSIGGDPMPNKDLIVNTITITPTGALTITAGT